jgi:hypothetical protein
VSCRERMGCEVQRPLLMCTHHKSRRPGIRVSRLRFSRRTAM